MTVPPQLAALLAPCPDIEDPDDRRRARLLVSLSFALTALLASSAVLSTITTLVAPDSPSTLGWGGTLLVALASVGFWYGYQRSRALDYRAGAWITIVVIYAFLTSFSLVFESAASLMAALAMPPMAGTIFLDSRGTIRLSIVSLIIGVAYLVPLADDPTSWIYSFGILVAVLGLTTLLALMRNDDLEQLDRLRELERADADRLRGEAELARTVQLAMLPAELPEAVGVELGAYSVPATEASGDFYDLFLVEHGSDPALGSLVVVVCDVAGKGMASALVVSAARTALRHESDRDPSPGLVLERVNRLLVDCLPPRLFLTLFYGVLDLATGELRFASGGHPHPFHWSAEAGELRELESAGLPLGLVEEADYEEVVVHLGAGDFVMAYTDGLVEALDADRGMYGFDAARRDVGAAIDGAATVQGRIDYVIAAMEDFVAGAPADDDVTLVALAIPPRSTPPLDLADASATAPPRSVDA